MSKLIGEIIEDARCNYRAVQQKNTCQEEEFEAQPRYTILISRIKIREVEMTMPSPISLIPSVGKIKPFMGNQESKEFYQQVSADIGLRVMLQVTIVILFGPHYSAGHDKV